MLITLSQEVSNSLQNVYTPFSFGMELIFCIAATIVYGAQYITKKSPHYMLMLIACDLTIVTQINTSKPVLIGLFVAEIALLVGAAVFSFKYSKQQKKAEGEKKKAPKTESDAVGEAFED